ncbi:MAG: ribosome maturation factor RimP [Intrasporangium sp.]|uniref:ribosome maturation factor RimP n=1 Tax=Intrasporangium sp. TaxID=1925024 RepID=UPI002647726E|nr:ribosome maturation factor RimP [Intrasporangium sp.]MDN5794204.1 ribosome maturation factor RimP [Intrasporangium sp.]
MSAADQLRESLGPVLAPLGLVIEDVTVSPAGKRRIVRVLVDADLAGLDATDTTSTVPPISLDRVSEATHAVSAVLDGSSALGEAPYVLEVSSPGVGRPLTTRDQFRRNVGRLVEVRHCAGAVTGRLVEVEPDAVHLAVPATKKTPGHSVRIELDDVQKGSVQVEFQRNDNGVADAPEDDPDIEEDP